ncbi:MAG: TolC family protein, partial [Muribaculaceae bacterium]|nr:TolC family protein [Muribaculaceae bacterium]
AIICAIISWLTCVSAQNNAFTDVVDLIMAANQQVVLDTDEKKVELMERQADNILSPAEIGGSYEFGTKGVGNKIGADITQSFDWPGVYAARRKAISNQAAAIEQYKEGRMRDLRMEISLALIDYVSVKRVMALRLDVYQRVSEAEKHYTTAFRHGEATILDLNKVKIARLDAMRNLSDIRNQLSAAESALLVLASGRELKDVLARVDTFALQSIKPLEYYNNEAKSTDPKLRHLELSAKTAALDVTSAKRSNLPGFTLGITHMNELGSHFNGVKVGVTLPSYGGKHKVAAARMAAESAAIQYTNAQIDRLSQISANYHNAMRMHDELQQYEALVMDHSVMEILQKALDGGEITVINYLEELNFFTEARISYEGMLREYAAALTRLNR